MLHQLHIIYQTVKQNISIRTNVINTTCHLLTRLTNHCVAYTVLVGHSLWADLVVLDEKISLQIFSHNRRGLCTNKRIIQQILPVAQ